MSSAPGKIMLAGEYAVLDGAEAVLVAVDRRAVARLDPAAPPPSAFLAAAAVALRGELGADHPAARAADRVVVDSSALREADRKLGLGSSAAATVAAVAAALAAEPVGPRAAPAPAIPHAAAPTSAERDLIHRLAHRAHGDAQAIRGARGSGADVAASVHGGVLAVTPRDAAPCAVRPLPWPSGLVWVPVWTGRPADTATLVAAVAAFAVRDGATHGRRIAALAEVATALARAFADADPGAALAAITAGADAIAALGHDAGVELETPVHRRIADLARDRGGAAKATGAGGGDLAVAVFTDPAGAADFAGACRSLGMPLPALRVETAGVRF